MNPQPYINLLKDLIGIPSFSREEDKTANAIKNFLQHQGVVTKRQGNNIWAYNQHFSESKPSILLNSHHDTVKPSSGYTNNPFEAIEKDGKLYGLGSNDAGGCLVSLIALFIHFYAQSNLNYNLILACTAEEEISGQNGIASILPKLGKIDLAVVGEPTQMQMAIAEKGLMVLDCTVRGISGHAARDEGENAIYKAMECIDWFKNFKFEKASETLGEIKMSVTVIQAGKQHNVVPDNCSFTVDVRTTDAYSNEETLAIIQQNLDCEVKARSTRLNPSGIDKNHLVVEAGKKMGWETYGSPTLSDQALIPSPSIKIGPGDSARSHTADEFIFLQEIENGIEGYIEWFEKFIRA